MAATINSNAALEFARERGYFCRVGGGGRLLVFYTGDELNPGTWLEAGRTGMTDNGQVSKNSVEMICDDGRFADEQSAAWTRNYGGEGW